MQDAKRAQSLEISLKEKELEVEALNHELGTLKSIENSHKTSQDSIINRLRDTIDQQQSNHRDEVQKLK
jgi:hypothetical protein